MINRFFIVIALVLLMCCLSVISFFAGRFAGQIEGSATATQLCLNRELNHKNQLLLRMAEFADDAQQASLALNAAIFKRQLSDDKTTRAIQDALYKTAHLRVDCVLPADVMQQLDAARVRANSAAAVGITQPMPTDRAADE